MELYVCLLVKTINVQYLKTINNNIIEDDCRENVREMTLHDNIDGPFVPDIIERQKSIDGIVSQIINNN